MTPAENYAAAEAILTEIAKTSEDAGKRIEAMLADDAYPQAREASEVMHQMVQLGLLQAQVHATLAMVNPDVLWPKQVVRIDAGAGVTTTSVFQQCICSKLAHEPLAKTATHPDCPIHGEKG